MNRLLAQITIVTVLTTLSLHVHHCTSVGYEYVITIDPLTGNDTESCITGKEPCKSLQWAFKSDHRKSSIQYILVEGIHYLDIPIEIFEKLEKLAFVGRISNDSEIVIQCTEENTGLTFVGASNVTFTNLVIDNCSSLRNSSSRDYNTSLIQTYKSLEFQVGLYFYLCKDITMQNVTVSNSPNATGVVMYDTSGTNRITDCVFENNSIHYPVENTSSPKGGGGGFYVEFTYCIPGSKDCADSDLSPNISESQYEFTGCSFVNNVANDSDMNLANYIVPSKADHVALGRGGGLSIFTNGASSSNSFKILNCTFQGNQAAWGGGMFVEFHDITQDNSVSILNSTFQGNKCYYWSDSGTAGGGMRIGFYVYEKTSGMGNSVNIQGCHFYDNSALNGGGLSISAALHNVNQENLARMTINHTNFAHNIARLGSALHIDGFPLILIGEMLTVHIKRCDFLKNSVDYIDPLGLQDSVPYQLGEGTVYIHSVPVNFRDFISFSGNNGSGLAIVRAEVDFSDAIGYFVGNKGNKGGGIALLGAAYIVINNRTTMAFTSNTAMIYGGAIFNKYISRRTLGSYADCFIRYTDPLIHAKDWNASFKFHFNRDLGGSNDNAIHSTSILPCSWAGESRTGIFCWKGWVFKEINGTILKDCSKMISSDIGRITFNQSSRNHYTAFPGQPFNLHLDVKDDLGKDLTEQTVFLASTNANTSGSTLGMNGDSFTYIWGTNTTVWGESGGDSIELQLDTIKDRVWHLKVFVELQPCPPGFTITNGSQSQLDNSNALNDTSTANSQQSLSCACSGSYGKALICEPQFYSARLANGYWMGHVESMDNDTYYSGTCPPGFCHENPHYSHFFLPNNSEDLQKLICGHKNREDTLCSRCIDGHGPAVNSPFYECINCTDPIGDTFKYISSVYIPLVVIFVVIILFNVRLTIGAANAFVLYAQIISSTFSVDADGQIPLILITGHYHANKLLKGYRIPYGIFNLEFVENLIPQLCIGTKLNTLAVIALDYIVALTPLLLIIVGVIIFRLASCINDHCYKTTQPSTQLQAPSRISAFLTNRKRSLSEAVLPAFSAFLLLSYTKLALTPSYILRQVALFDNQGHEIHPKRAYFAGHLSVHDKSYLLYYVLPASIIFATFVAIPPLLLLDYPLRMFEWCLNRVNCLWRFYPVGKVHFFLDTFQGCFKNKYRFFAGLYFVFRLVINLNYSFTQTWLEQFVIKEISCILMIMLLAICQPYNAQNDRFNRIDVLIFTNLAIVNGLSFYLYEYAQNNPQTETLPLSAFIIQYILIFLPLIYIISYIVWEKTKPCHNRLSHRTRTSYSRPINYDVFEESCDTMPPNKTPSLLDSNSYNDRRRFEESEELFFQRAEFLNRYKPPNSSVVIAKGQETEKKHKEEPRQTTVSEDSGLRSIPDTNSGNHYYGSTKSRSSTKESASASAYSTTSVSSVGRNSFLYQSSDENSDSEK
jgi:hypothetical protein